MVFFQSAADFLYRAHELVSMQYFVFDHCEIHMGTEALENRRAVEYGNLYL